MIVRRGTGDLNKIYRPCRIDEVIGHDHNIRMVTNYFKNNTLPHASLFTGPSGCGKTTFARIIALGLNCLKTPGPNPCCKCSSCASILGGRSLAVMEVDAARTSDVNTIRSIADDLSSAPLGTEMYKVIIVDEAHNLSGKAEDVLLKPSEDTYDHVYIILCTNLPEKLKVVTKNRCKLMQFSRLDNEYVYTLLEQVSQFEGMNYKPEILKYVTDESEGSPRTALTFLQQVNAEGSWTKEAASLVINAGVDMDQAEVIDFCRLLVRGESFIGLLKFYKKIKKIPAESVRITMRGFMLGCIKNSKTYDDAKKFHSIVELLRTPYHNAKPEHDLLSDVFKITTIIRGR